MRAFIFTLLLTCFAITSLSAQIFTPVKWKSEYKHVQGNKFDLIHTAKIDAGWSIYSQFLESDDGPVRTSFVYEKAGEHFKLVGKTKEKGKKKEGFDELFGMNVIKFTDKCVFTQRVTISDYSKPIVGYLEFMTCDATKCLPPDMIDFELSIKKPAPSTGAVTPDKKETPKVVEKEQPVKEKIQAAKEEVTTKIVEQVPAPKTEKIPTEKPSIAKVEQAPTNIVEMAEEGTMEQSGFLDPVKWKVKGQKISDNEYDLVFTAIMEKGWSIYSQFTDEGGPVPTSFTFDEGDFSLIGKAKEAGQKKEGKDPLFDDINVIKFNKGKPQFTQRIKTTNPDSPITGYLTFMTCDKTQCLPPTDISFVFEPNTLNALVNLEADNFMEARKSTTDPKAIAVVGNGANNKDGGLYSIAAPDLKNPVSTCGEAKKDKKSKSLWGIFVLGLLGGFVALLTPCVFPMIPLTVSFFTKSGGDKKKGIRDASMYGFFIFLVYLLLSTPFHLLDTINPDILNEISTNVILNVVFFLVFLFFAFSFFGYYELTLPSRVTNKVSSAEGAGGMVGIFFMALTLAIVSFSCTGPILGSLLAGALSSDGGAMQLTAGMGGFGLALALPFALFAAFPQIMNSLPKSGGWLNTVKVVLGFAELALALKFLSNADLVKHWGLLKVEVFLGLWILIALGLALYLFCKIKFPHDSPNAKVGVGRMITGIASLAFAGYLATGFIFDEEAGSLRSLQLLSGLAPPACYSIWNPCDCPQNIRCFKDFDEGMAYAQKENLPVAIDFTGYACVNCRKMEEQVWPDSRIKNKLNDDYVLISLYVDDKEELPKKEQIMVTRANGSKRKLRTYGNKWAHFQASYFENNSQPYYCLISPDGELLNPPVGYTPDNIEYIDFLECGLNAYETIKKPAAIGEK